VAVTVDDNAPLLCAALAVEGGSMTAASTSSGYVPADGGGVFAGQSVAEIAAVLASAEGAADCFAIDVYEYVCRMNTPGRLWRLSSLSVPTYRRSLSLHVARRQKCLYFFKAFCKFLI
jgi:hypothetical protein